MSDNPIQPNLGDDEKKRKDKEAFQAYFANERRKEDANNRTALTWVIIIGVGIPMVFTIIYFFFLFISVIAKGF